MKPLYMHYKVKKHLRKLKNEKNEEKKRKELITFE